MSTVSASDWMKGISLSILASMIGGASKLAIRKSWLMEEDSPPAEGDSPPSLHDNNDNDISSTTPPSQNEPQVSKDDTPPPEQHQEHPDSLVSKEEGFADEPQPQSSSNLPTVAADQNGPNNQDNDSNDERLQPDARKRSSCLSLSLRASGMIGMTFLNPACCVFAMAYASPSILAPFSGLTLVWIVLLSLPLIGEEPSRNQILAASLIIVGQVLIGIFGDHTNSEGMTVADVRDSYLYPPFLLFLVALSAWMCLLWHWMHQSEHEEGVHETLRRFAWGAAGGSITGLQNFLKDSLTIWKAVQADDSTSSFPWYLYLMVTLAACTAFGGLLFLTACMKRYDATYSGAMFVGSFVVSASIMSAAHYATFSHLDTLYNWILYPTGLVVLMGGVWMLIREQEQRLNSSEERYNGTTRGGSVDMEPLVSEDTQLRSNNRVV